jgi:hypothetical protein
MLWAVKHRSKSAALRAHRMTANCVPLDRPRTATLGATEKREVNPQSVSKVEPNRRPSIGRAAVRRVASRGGSLPLRKPSRRRYGPGATGLRRQRGEEVPP